MPHWAIPVHLGMARAYLRALHLEGREAHNSGRPTLGAAQITRITSCLQEVGIHCHMPSEYTKEAKDSNNDIFESKMYHTAHKHTTHNCIWTKTLLCLLKHGNWPPIPCVQYPMTGFLQHSLLPLFCASWA